MRLFSLLIFVANTFAFQAPAPTGVLEGRVIDSVSGEPVRKASVSVQLRLARPAGVAGTGPAGMIYDSSMNGNRMPAARMGRPGMNPGSGLLTDANGNFRAALPPGDYQVAWVERTGYVYSPSISAPTVTLTAGGTATGFTIKLNKHGVIAGRILDEDGEPLANVQVSTLRWNLLNGQRTLAPTQGGSTNDLGEYRIFGLPPGKYFLSAQTHHRGNSESRMTYAPMFFPGVTDVSAAQAIEVTPGAVRQGTDLRLQRVPVVKVSGKVAGVAEGEQAGRERRGGAMVMLMPRGGAFMPMAGQHSAPVTPNGDFEIPNVPPGSYVLRVNSFGPNQDRRLGRVNLEVGNRDVTGVAIRLDPPAELKGQVRAQGATLTSVMVYLEFHGAGGASAYGRVDAEGRFSIANVGGETYRVRVQGMPQGYYVKSIQLGGQTVDKTVDFTGGVNGELVVTLEKGTATLSGVVVDKEQKPVPAVRVMLFNARNEIVTGTNSDQEGRYSLVELAPGDYRIAADNIDSSDPDAVEKLAASAQKLTLASAAQETRQIEVK